MTKQPYQHVNLSYRLHGAYLIDGAHDGGGVVSGAANKITVADKKRN